MIASNNPAVRRAITLDVPPSRLFLSVKVSSQERCDSEAGLTLVELIIVVAIISILASAAIPIARFQVRREKERELRRDLWEMRAAIDRYKDAADKGAFQSRPTLSGILPICRLSSMASTCRERKFAFSAVFPSIP